MPVIYGGQLTVAMGRSKLDEHRLREANLEVLPTGQKVQAGPFEIELVHLTHSIPDMVGVILRCELGTVLFTGDYKFDQTPVGGAPADVSRLAELGRDGVLLLCGDSTNADRPGLGVRERGRAEPGARVRALPGADRRRPRSPRTSTACSRSSTRRSSLGRKVCLVGRSMRKNVNIGRTLGHIVVPEGTLIPPRELDNWPDDRVVIISTGSQGEPLSALRRMAYRDHPQIELHEGDTVVFSATPIPGNERAVNETIDRLYQIGCEVITAARRGDPRLRARLAGGAQADAQPDPAEVRDAGARRLQAGPDPLAARPGGRRAGRERVPGRERAAAGDHRVGRVLGRAARPRG